MHEVGWCLCEVSPSSPGVSSASAAEIRPGQEDGMGTGGTRNICYTKTHYLVGYLIFLSGNF